MSSLILRNAAQNIKRSGWRAFAVIFMMTVTYLILGILLVTMFTTKNFAGYFAQLPEVIGFFSDEATEEQILAVKIELEGTDYVSEVTYISKEQAMEQFLEENKDNQEVIEAVTVNVFPAHLNVKTKSLEYVDDASSYFENNEYITDVHAFEGVLDTLKKIVTGIEVFGIALLVIFTISTMLIIFLVVGITVYSRKNEIIIMKLVGATNWAVRAPYMLQSLFYAFIAVFIATLILIPTLYYYYDDAIYFISGNFNVISLPLEFLFIGSAVLLAFGVVLSLISSYLATRRYINY